MSTHYSETLEQAACRLAGNWRRWESFVWDADLPLADVGRVAIVYTTNRDADALTRSNHRIITRELEQFAGELKDGQDLQWESHGHWAVGHVDGFSVRVFDAAGNITPAFRAWYELAAQLEEYPVLDDSDYSDEEYQEACDVWRACYSEGERLQYIREHRDEFEFRSLADLMGCVRGKYFAGYASELLT